MHLTRDEEKILNGERGEGFQRAMEMLVSIGDIYKADKLIDIASSHLSSAAYGSSGETGIRFLEWLVQTGASFEVLTTLNPHSVEHDRWRELGFPEDFSRRQMANAEAYKKLGAVGTFTCTPFLSGNLPRFGEHLSWSESSALSYANTAVGARTNREGALGALSAALIGKTPNYGLHLAENRLGRVLIRVKAELKNHSDYSALGWSVGMKVVDQIPVFSGVHTIGGYDLNSLCASLAVSGAVPMCHLPGITPEAPTLKAALGNRKPRETFTIDDAELKRVYQDRSTKGPGSEIDLVLLGCPHYGYREIMEVADFLKGKKVCSNVRLWITTSTPIASVARRAGWVDVIEEAGGEIMCSLCALISKAGFFGFETMATDSAKATYYGIGQMGLKDTILGSMEDCIRAAVSGKWSD